MPKKTTKTTKQKTTKRTTRSKKQGKTLIAFYSRTDTTMRVAHDLALHLGADIIRIRDHTWRRGPIGWFKAGFDAAKKNETEISYRDFNADDYGRIIIGTPVWASAMTPAIRTFIKELPANKNLEFATFATHAGSPGSTLKTLSDALEKKKYSVFATAEFKTFGKNKHQIHQEIAAFASQLKGK